MVGGSLHGPCLSAVTRHSFASVSWCHASWCRLTFPWSPSAPWATSLDQVLVHWQDSQLHVLCEHFCAACVLLGFQWLAARLALESLALVLVRAYTSRMSRKTCCGESASDGVGSSGPRDGFLAPHCRGAAAGCRPSGGAGASLIKWSLRWYFIAPPSSSSPCKHVRTGFVGTRGARCVEPDTGNALISRSDRTSRSSWTVRAASRWS